MLHPVSPGIPVCLRNFSPCDFVVTPWFSMPRVRLPNQLRKALIHSKKRFHALLTAVKPDASSAGGSSASSPISTSSSAFGVSVAHVCFLSTERDLSTLEPASWGWLSALLVDRALVSRALLYSAKSCSYLVFWSSVRLRNPTAKACSISKLPAAMAALLLASMISLVSLQYKSKTFLGSLGTQEESGWAISGKCPLLWVCRRVSAASALGAWREFESACVCEKASELGDWVAGPWIIAFPAPSPRVLRKDGFRCPRFVRRGFSFGLEISQLCTLEIIHPAGRIDGAESERNQKPRVSFRQLT